ncbi:MULTISPECIES: FAD/NAD(P)-binding oxidoreductase [unclassified Bradyrhizobium]|uniref:FAD/NAD(P)-binding oxidoreductase n=1 Tax=unclassified Bradyrhizobium TaxID=2631580 RepID=UPI0028EC8A22|nr:MULTISPECIES: FAD/NAD(P)-binding oxidoreductase [unclassified Bradyrhizobium]
MTTVSQRTRREVGGLIAAGAALLAAPAVLRAQTAGRVIVVGGGFGGASCARALRQVDAKLAVTLVEANRTFTACPLSNEVIAGLRDIGAQQFGYDRIAAEGVRVVLQAATAIDAPAHKITLADGTTLAYDRLVLAPGIDIDFSALQGYDEAASTVMPHAYKAGEQTLLLRTQIEAMPEGGTVAIAVPANPSRCPPAPYERASLIAHYLKAHKPKSKVLILDAKDSFSQQKLFEQAWQELYPSLIERIPLSQGGRVTGVEIATRTVVTEFGNYNPDVTNIIPPQKAGRIAALAGAADRTGWCPIDAATFASKLVPDVHVIGDACLGGGIPKSASAAQAQGKACAAVIASQLAGKTPRPPTLDAVCYSLLKPDKMLSFRGLYEPKGDIFELEWVFGGFDNWADMSPAADAEGARKWFRDVTADAFG